MPDLRKHSLADLMIKRVSPRFEPGPIPSGKADSKPLPDNDSERKSPKSVIGVERHPFPKPKNPGFS